MHQLLSTPAMLPSTALQTPAPSSSPSSAGDILLYNHNPFYKNIVMDKPEKLGTVSNLCDCKLDPFNPANW